jgi:hypothetical protein
MDIELFVMMMDPFFKLLALTIVLQQQIQAR